MKRRITFIIFLSILIVAGCKSGHKVNEYTQPLTNPHEEANAIYYWKTVLDADSADIEFVRSHKIKRAYIRFFDVVKDESPVAKDIVIPNATLKVKTPLSVDEIIPTIYITLNAIRSMDDIDKWAELIVERIDNMSKYNAFGELHEIQLDCDWTQETEDTYFRLCKAVKRKMISMDSTNCVSSTIRLHQLAKTAPPVDYGVLMLYNTGSFENEKEVNSILDVKDVAPYVKRLAKYPLPLDFAYPSYSWNLLFRNNRFYGLLRDDITDDRNIVEIIEENKYKLRKDTIINETMLRMGDVIRRETSRYSSIMDVKKMIEKEYGDRSHSNIIYHLDSSNLSKYSYDEIESIYK